MDREFRFGSLSLWAAAAVLPWQRGFIDECFGGILTSLRL